MVSWNKNQKRADDVSTRQQGKPSNLTEVSSMNKKPIKPVKPTKGEWWFFGWGLAIGAVLMGSILTIMQHVKV